MLNDPLVNLSTGLANPTAYFLLLWWLRIPRCCLLHLITILPGRYYGANCVLEWFIYAQIPCLHIWGQSTWYYNIQNSTANYVLCHQLCCIGLAGIPYNAFPATCMSNYLHKSIQEQNAWIPNVKLLRLVITVVLNFTWWVLPFLHLPISNRTTILNRAIFV